MMVAVNTITVSGQTVKSKLENPNLFHFVSTEDIDDVTCNGYKYWVNMLEPDVNQYCIRCCKSQSDCNLGLSTYGCERIIPGDYS